MSSGLNFEQNKNLVKIDLADSKHMSKLKGRVAVTSGFGCVNPECGIRSNCPQIYAVKRQYLEVRIIDVTKEVILAKPADSFGNRRTCYVRYENCF